MTLSGIADDVGRTEDVIKKNLKGKMGISIILEAYNKLKEKEVDNTLSVALGLRGGIRIN